MKKAKILLSLLLGAALFGSVIGLSACGGTEDEPGPNPGPGGTESTELTFESGSSASIDEKAFELSIVMKADKTLSLTAECTGKAQQGGGPGGPGDKGDKGDKGDEGGKGEGGQPALFADETPGEGSEEEEEIDYGKYSYTKSGTWSEETGYGYIFNLDSETFHVNYDIYQSVHYFYYTPAAMIDGEVKTAASAVKMTSSVDAAYQQKLAADYQIYEARECTYHFYGGADSVGGNLNVTDLYLMPDGVAIDMTGRDSITYTKGTWSEKDGVITVVLGEDQYTSEAATTKKGYRINRGSYYVYTADENGEYLGEDDFAA